MSEVFITSFRSNGVLYAGPHIDADGWHDADEKARLLGMIFDVILRVDGILVEEIEMPTWLPHDYDPFKLRA